MAELSGKEMRESQHGGSSCRECNHYYITHDSSFPYGCAAIGFKSRALPCRTVFEASGEHCHRFEMKLPRK